MAPNRRHWYFHNVTELRKAIKAPSENFTWLRKPKSMILSKRKGSDRLSKIRRRFQIILRVLSKSEPEKILRNMKSSKKNVCLPASTSKPTKTKISFTFRGYKSCKGLICWTFDKINQQIPVCNLDIWICVTKIGENLACKLFFESSLTLMTTRSGYALSLPWPWPRVALLDRLV